MTRCMRVLLAVTMLPLNFVGVSHAALSNPSAAVQNDAGSTRSSYSVGEKVRFVMLVQNGSVASGSILFSFEVKDPNGVRRYSHTGNSAPASVTGQAISTVSGVPVSSFYTVPGDYTLTATAALASVNTLTQVVTFKVQNPSLSLLLPTNGDQSVLANPLRLQWIGSGAARYRVTIADNNSFQQRKTFIQRETVQTFLDYRQPSQAVSQEILTPGTLYYWKVEGLDSAGNVISRSDIPWSFMIKASAVTPKAGVDLSIDLLRNAEISRTEEQANLTRGFVLAELTVRNASQLPQDITGTISLTAGSVTVPEAPKEDIPAAKYAGSANQNHSIPALGNRVLYFKVPVTQTAPNTTVPLFAVLTDSRDTTPNNNSARGTLTVPNAGSPTVPSRTPATSPIWNLSVGALTPEMASKSVDEVVSNTQPLPTGQDIYVTVFAVCNSNAADVAGKKFRIDVTQGGVALQPLLPVEFACSGDMPKSVSDGKFLSKASVPNGATSLNFKATLIDLATKQTVAEQSKTVAIGSVPTAAGSSSGKLSSGAISLSNTSAAATSVTLNVTFNSPIAIPSGSKIKISLPGFTWPGTPIATFTAPSAISNSASFASTVLTVTVNGTVPAGAVTFKVTGATNPSAQAAKSDLRMSLHSSADARLAETNSGTLVAVTSGSANATAADTGPSILAFTSQPTIEAAGVLFTQQVVVTVLKRNGEIDRSSTARISLAVTSGVGTLLGSTTVSAVAGVATFTNLKIDKAGTGYILEATASGLSLGRSHGIDIMATAADAATARVKEQTLSLAKCIATPTLAGCFGVLPTMATCLAKPSTEGCSVVLPKLSFTAQPTVSDKTASSVTISFKASATGDNVRVIAVPRDAAAPTVAQVMAGTGAVGTAPAKVATTGADQTATITGLSASTAYDFYAALESSGVLSTKVTATTAAAPGGITRASVTSTNLSTNAATTITVYYTSPVNIPAGGTITVKLPGYAFPAGAVTVTPGSGFTTGALTGAVTAGAPDTVVVTLGTGSTVTAGTSVTFTVPATNPASAMEVYPSISASLPDGTKFGSAAARKFVIAAPVTATNPAPAASGGAITGAAVTLSNNSAGATGVRVNVSMTTSSPIPAGGKIKVVLPGFSWPAAPTVTFTAPSALANAAAFAANVLTVTIPGGSPAGTFTFSATGATNPSGPQAALSNVSLSAHTSADAVIAATNAGTLQAIISAAAGPATKLVFATQPSGAEPNKAFTTQPVVEVQSANGQVVTDYTGNISLAIKAGTGQSGAVLTCSPVAAVAGRATFTGCKIDGAGTGFVLTASVGTLTSADSMAFWVTPDSSSSVTPAASTRSSQTISVKLKLDSSVLDTFRADFSTQLKNDISKALNIDSSRIDIQSVTPQ